MSGVEIERKFLVRKGDAYKRVAFSCTHIQQGYIPAEGATVRVRVRDDHAYLTIKSRSQDGGLSRYEFEKEITLDEGCFWQRVTPGGVRRSEARPSRARSVHIMAHSPPYITRCVHLSIMLTSDSGVSGMGMIHSIHITTIHSVEKG